MIDEPWIQPTTAPPRQPEVADEAIEEDSTSLASRSHALPWMEASVRPAYTRRITGIDVFTAAVVIAFLFALLVALPMLLLQTL